MSKPATSNDPVAKAIAEAKEPITEYVIDMPESRQSFPIPAEDAQTSEAVREAVSEMYTDMAACDITCAQVGGRLTITLRSKPAGKG